MEVGLGEGGGASPRTGYSSQSATVAPNSFVASKGVNAQWARSFVANVFVVRFCAQF